MTEHTTEKTQHRILVTGSRAWSDEDKIESAMWNAWGDLGNPDIESVTLVHGACPTGADALAASIASKVGMSVEARPADWSKGRKAGPERNAAMVALGADVCLAFIGDCTSPRCNKPGKHPSHGASGCADLAEAAGIPTVRYSPAGGEDRA